jgi:hypothetical protein
MVIFVFFVAFVPEREAVSREPEPRRYFLSRTSTPETGPRQVVPE